jgi:hypothetical protein
VSHCSTPNPERPEVLCDKGQPCFGFHANAIAGLTWPGNPLPEREDPKKGSGSRKGKLALIAQRASR